MMQISAGTMFEFPPFEFPVPHLAVFKGAVFLACNSISKLRKF